MNTGNLISAMSILPTLQSFEGIQRRKSKYISLSLSLWITSSDLLAIGRCLPGFVYGSNVHEYQTDNPIECPVDYWTHKDNPAQNECSCVTLYYNNLLLSFVMLLILRNLSD
jgi:hypothetical protein